jgi:hypothetical protein
VKRWLWLCGCLASLALGQTEGDFLDVSIAVFTHAATTDPASAVAAADDSVAATVAAVRESEQRLLPLYLRYRLEQSGRFGAVRVLPLLDNGAELRIDGSILESTGSRLALQIRASDSLGRLWIDQTYAGTAIRSESLSDDAFAEDVFAGVFSALIRDLVAQLEQQDAAALRRIKNAALVRYGHGLVPAAFEDFMRQQTDGSFSLERLPADDDPLLRRILAIREREYLFIDVVDEQYQQFYGDVKPVYDLWRNVQAEQAESSSARTVRELATPSAFPRGSYRALQDSYNNFRWAKLQQLYVEEVGQGFTNEVAPTQLALDDSVYKLSGTLEQQYREWRGLLAELFALESAVHSGGAASTSPGTNAAP